MHRHSNNLKVWKDFNFPQRCICSSSSSQPETIGDNLKRSDIYDGLRRSQNVKWGVEISPKCLAVEIWVDI